MLPIPDHALRFELANELHARPHPSISAPGRAAFFAIKREKDAARRNRDDDRTDLIALLDRYAVAHPQPNAKHYSAQIGRHLLKWENHTEFSTYLLISDVPSELPFDATLFASFPSDWIKNIRGVRVTSAIFSIEPSITEQALDDYTRRWFEIESLAMSKVHDGTMTVAGDYRIDPNGHMRFAVFCEPQTVEQRIGRVVQYLCDIETYKSMAMLGFSRAHELNAGIASMDQLFTELSPGMRRSGSSPESMLNSILEVSAQLEDKLAQNSFRLGATPAYESIVHERIAELREVRHGDAQTMEEFMNRRFDPAMRTVRSTQLRLERMADRAQRAADLLRTMVDVERSAQNQKLLESMNKRADLQLRLQRTVEGLSVVAISYYAVNLVKYILAPLHAGTSLSEPMLLAIVTPLVVAGVWMVVRKIRQMHVK